MRARSHHAVSLLALAAAVGGWAATGCRERPSGSPSEPLAPAWRARPDGPCPDHAIGLVEPTLTLREGRTTIPVLVLERPRGPLVHGACRVVHSTGALAHARVQGPLSAIQTTELAESVVAPRLRAVTGVEAVVLVRGLRQQTYVWLDSARLRAFNLSPDEVRRALEDLRPRLPPGITAFLEEAPLRP